ncbi:hypothetical protein WN944_006101 [Citrus x changshan-huyou]|uniref:Protein kinase domain-containing protein n=1 Tax=Citrus x changshan-huyou TaxID=2935761 RepID=A0AAP0MIL3_9ROSI
MDIRLKEKFFKQNGGLLLQQMLNSYDGSVIDRCKLFSSKELDKATNHFNVNRILGQGGQGTVYKGRLEDGRIIAIKKSKLAVDDEELYKLEEFINEIFILSQINHRNVVKLLGCCLETEFPLLVYEFIPNGTLYQHLHDRHQNEEYPLTWEMRFRVATEVAGALAYLHSGASSPIYHRDIKSTNILLDERYRAKVADFGTSKFIAMDQTHVTTKIQGTFGYLDPEYHQSSQLTDKSDVYSFGVVLVELLTGKKPIFSTGNTSQENVSLAAYFVHSMRKNRLYHILDDQVMKLGKKNQIVAFANLAERCLDLNGKKRPTMEEVSMELNGIRGSNFYVVRPTSPTSTPPSFPGLRISLSTPPRLQMLTLDIQGVNEPLQQEIIPNLLTQMKQECVLKLYEDCILEYKLNGRVVINLVSDHRLGPEANLQFCSISASRLSDFSDRHLGPETNLQFCLISASHLSKLSDRRFSQKLLQ